MAGLTKKLAGNVVTCFNGNGFLAQNVLARLGRQGAQLVIAYRGSRYDEEKMRVVGDLGQVYFSHYNLKDEKSLHEAMKYSNIVVNTIGKLNETRNFSFNEVHVEGPRRMARIAREAGVEKFIHISSLNANPNPTPQCLKNGSQFLKSKYHGELAVREEFPNAIIFRPSDIIGEKDDFVNHFLDLWRCFYTCRLAIWDYYDGVTKMPVFVRDLSAGIEAAILDPTADGKTFQAVGPYRYDFYELIEFMRTCGGQGLKYDEGEIVNLRYEYHMRLAMWVCNKLQKYPLLTWERVERDLTTDYVDPKLPTLRDLGVELTPLEDWIKVLGFYKPREIRYEIAYESALRIDLPKRLAVI